MPIFEIDAECLVEDLRRISKWVKEDLYRGCKFIYRGKDDLDVSGNIYQWYKAECGPKLRGYKQAEGEQDRHSYLSKAWRVAAKQNTVNNGLALRRGGVYTVMQNRFMGTYSCSAGYSLFRETNQRSFHI
jgi:hypothetical protein